MNRNTRKGNIGLTLLIVDSSDIEDNSISSENTAAIINISLNVVMRKMHMLAMSMASTFTLGSSLCRKDVPGIKLKSRFFIFLQSDIGPCLIFFSALFFHDLDNFTKSFFGMEYFFLYIKSSAS